MQLSENFAAWQLLSEAASNYRFHNIGTELQTATTRIFTTLVLPVDPAAQVSEFMGYYTIFKAPPALCTANEWLACPCWTAKLSKRTVDISSQCMCSTIHNRPGHGQPNTQKACLTNMAAWSPIICGDDRTDLNAAHLVAV